MRAIAARAAVAWMAVLLAGRALGPAPDVAAAGPTLAGLPAGAGTPPPATAAGPGEPERSGVAGGLAVPLIRQAPERCGPAALAMVLRYYGADSSALAEVERAYDPAFKGSLITDLAAAARRAGYRARVAQVPEDSLRAWLEQGVPPVLLYRRGAGALSVGHYGVLVGWDAGRERYALNDGGAATRTLSRRDLVRRWEAAGSLALVVSPPDP